MQPHIIINGFARLLCNIQLKNQQTNILQTLRVKLKSKVSLKLSLRVHIGGFGLYSESYTVFLNLYEPFQTFLDIRHQTLPPTVGDYESPAGWRNRGRTLGPGFRPPGILSPWGWFLSQKEGVKGSKKDKVASKLLRIEYNPWILAKIASKTLKN